MNYNTYGKIYGEFHRCHVSTTTPQLIVLDMTHESDDTFLFSRVVNSDRVTINAQQPFLQALKAHFKSDEPTSVFCKNVAWTIILGNDKFVYATRSEKATFRLYASTYFVKDPQIVASYLQNTTRPAYDHVFLYKNTILYLDNYDIPYPGGCYYHSNVAEEFYRICFLTNEPLEHVKKLVSDWTSRQGVYNIPYLTKNAITEPKFIRYQPIPSVHLTDPLTSDFIPRTFNKPHLLIHDILAAYQRNRGVELKNLGIIIDFPFYIKYDGALPLEVKQTHLVGLCVNGQTPDRTLLIHRPYDTYAEYNEVPGIIWTPFHYVPSYFAAPDVKKVIVDNTVIGLEYNNGFFCFNYPLLEGRPNSNRYMNNECLTSVTKNLDGLVVIQTFRHNAKYSINRVNLPNVPFETWCITLSKETDPYMKKLKLPYLVDEWLNLFMKVADLDIDMDPNIVRLAMIFSMHKICYNLRPDDIEEKIEIGRNSVTFYTKPEVIEFINMMRVENKKVDKYEDYNKACNIL